MSTIPAGLRSDYMRQRMEDKATIQHIGSLYMGGSTRVTYQDTGGSTISAAETEELVPGGTGLPLVSNGPNARLSYRQLDFSVAFGTGPAIPASKLGTGTIVAANPSGPQYTLSIQEDNSDTDVLVISFYANS